jgi:hypothetical protein
MNASKALHYAFAASPDPVHGPPGGRPQEKQPEVVSAQNCELSREVDEFPAPPPYRRVA